MFLSYHFTYNVYAVAYACLILNGYTSNAVYEYCYRPLSYVEFSPIIITLQMLHTHLFTCYSSV